MFVKKYISVFVTVHMWCVGVHVCTCMYGCAGMWYIYVYRCVCVSVVCIHI